MWPGYWPLFGQVGDDGLAELFLGYLMTEILVDMMRIKHPDPSWPQEYDQWEANIQVTWSLSANESPVSDPK